MFSGLQDFVTSAKKLPCVPIKRHPTPPDLKPCMSWTNWSTHWVSWTSQRTLQPGVGGAGNTFRSGKQLLGTRRSDFTIWVQMPLCCHSIHQTAASWVHLSHWKRTSAPSHTAIPPEVRFALLVLFWIQETCGARPPEMRSPQNFGPQPHPFARSFQKIEVILLSLRSQLLSRVPSEFG